MATETAPARIPMDAKVALQQCTNGALMTVGASDIELYRDCLQFKARIHPRRKDGTRAGRARVMCVRIELTPADLYRVTVGYLATPCRIMIGNMTNHPDWVEHFQTEDIYAEDLAKVLVSLDSGTEARWT